MVGEIVGLTEAAPEEDLVHHVVSGEGFVYGNSCVGDMRSESGGALQQWDSAGR